MKKIKRIGICTSGGDCSGLNTVIYAIVRACESKNIETYGIFNGAYGLLYPDLKYIKLTLKDFKTQFSPMRAGGTILKSANADTRKQDNMKERLQQGIKELKLDSLILIGGDGSAMIVSELIQGTDINLIIIPKTIDNDTPITDYSIGFDTARSICMDALDKIQTTAYSHDRVMILEVMGRNTGHLALHTAIAGGADICLIPELKYDIKNIVNKLEKIKKNGVDHALIVVAEGCKPIENDTDNDNCGFGNYLSKKLKQEGISNRATVLGYIQRGGSPTAYDRITASIFAIHALKILLEGKTNRLVILKNGEASNIDLFDAVSSGQRIIEPNNQLLITAKELGIYIGE